MHNHETDRIEAALQLVMQSRHPYVNNTLKRLAKAAHTRINGGKKKK